MRKCRSICAVCPYVDENTIYDCNTPKPIYLITCNNCRDQYVGYSRDCLHNRLKYHLDEIAAGVTPFGRHFQKCKKVNMKIQVIDQGDSEQSMIRKRNEWQQHLNPAINEEYKWGMCSSCNKGIYERQDKNMITGNNMCSDCFNRHQNRERELEHQGQLVAQYAKYQQELGTQHAKHQRELGTQRMLQKMLNGSLESSKKKQEELQKQLEVERWMLNEVNEVLSAERDRSIGQILWRKLQTRRQ